VIEERSNAAIEGGKSQATYGRIRKAPGSERAEGRLLASTFLVSSPRL
jgi:hypothetical protein